MRKGSRLIIGMLAASLVVIAFSPFIVPQSNNPCSGCHGSNYHQYLDVLEGDAQNVLPPELNDSEISTIAVMVKNICNTAKYNVMTSISVTLSSQNGSFGAQVATYNVGSLNPGQTAKATWKIYPIARGWDKLVISASGYNSHYACSFTDHYSPTPDIFVNKTVLDLAPSISVSSPASGLRLTGGTEKQVTWMASDEEKPSCRVDLYYSTDDFKALDEAIASGLAGDKTFLWTLPLIDSDNVKVRATIVDPKGQRNETVMGRPFCIVSTPPTVTDLSPADMDQNVTDSAILLVSFSEPVVESSAQAAFTISPDPGGIVWTWNSEQTTMTAVHTPFDPGQTYTCSMGMGVKDLSFTGNYLRATAGWSFSTPQDIVPVPSILLSSPSNGAKYWWGDRIPVVWSASGGTGSLGVNFSISIDGGPGTLLANRLPNTGNHLLRVPAVESGNCRLEATVYDQNGMEARSASEGFSIARNITLNATFPANGTTFVSGDTGDITWTCTGGHGPVSVSLFFQPDENSTFQPVASGLPKAGSQRWMAPELNTKTARFILNATDDWNRSVEKPSAFFEVRTKEPPPPPPPPPARNDPPLVIFHVLDRNLVEKNPARFDASGSFDPDGDTIYYFWDFGDGTGMINVSDPNTSHPFPHPGTFQVRLVVSDGTAQSFQTMAVVVDPADAARPGSDDEGWPLLSLGVIIIIIGLVGLAYSGASRLPGRTGKESPSQPVSETQHKAPPSTHSQAQLEAEYIRLYGALPPQRAAAGTTALEAVSAGPAASAGTPPALAKTAFPILFDQEGCVGCGTCAGRCPGQAITMSDQKPMLDAAKCNSCGACVGECPKGALSLNPSSIPKTYT